MGGPIIMSALFHGVAVTLLYLGLPHLKHDELSSERVVVVELLTIDERRNLPEYASVVEAKKELREEDKALAIAPPPAPPPPAITKNSTTSFIVLDARLFTTKPTLDAFVALKT